MTTNPTRHAPIALAALLFAAAATGCALPAGEAENAARPAGPDVGSPDPVAPGPEDDPPEMELAWKDAPPDCPAGPPPSATPARRFDLAGTDGDCASCPASDEQCMCKPEFARLNQGKPHFLLVGSDRHKKEIWAAGNFQAIYYNTLNAGWQDGKTAEESADLAMEWVGQQFKCGTPKWIFLNEMLRGGWLSSPAYRKWVVAFAKRLRQTHGRAVIVASQFRLPAQYAPFDADWKALAAQAFVAAEVYLAGPYVTGPAYAQGVYADTTASYAAVGVPKSRLMLVEHFAHTTTGLDGGPRGRWGASAAQWKFAVQTRGKAAGDLGFAGFVSYAWGFNQMHATEAFRLEIEDAYAAQALP